MLPCMLTLNIFYSTYFQEERFFEESRISLCDQFNHSKSHNLQSVLAHHDVYSFFDMYSNYVQG